MTKGSIRSKREGTTGSRSLKSEEGATVSHLYQMGFRLWLKFRQSYHEYNLKIDIDNQAVDRKEVIERWCMVVFGLFTLCCLEALHL